ncbi:otoferlin-like [Centruroides sculpturatus]|uniref:otoferlin-like n=1 Tax=Centruroides sculpturatus TaxID=218467 RepID=UPI000C6D5F5F|nr:otoferlin-like [Centruroides sculpturatus]
MTVDRPRVDIECAGHVLQSSVILNCKKNPNFSVMVKHFDVELPDQEMYCPPLTIRVMDCRSFGRFTLVGTHVISALQKFMYRPIVKKEQDSSRQTYNFNNRNILSVPVEETVIQIDADTHAINMKEINLTIEGQMKKSKKELKSEANRQKKKQQAEEALSDDESNKDWWSGYFASYETMIKDSKDGTENQNNTNCVSPQPSVTMNGEVQCNGEVDPDQLSAKDTKKMEKELQRLEYQHLPEAERKRRTFKGTSTAVRLAARLSPKSQRKEAMNESQIKIYPCELESVTDFNGFKEWLHSFELFRGKRTGDELEDQNRIVGIFKGSLQVYKYPLPKSLQEVPGAELQNGMFHGIPSNDPIHVLIRIYIVKATDLHPADLNGKADPYIVINLGNKRTSDKENYISKQLNPVFGKCFEFEATFPQDSLLTVQIFDWDLLGSDDLIGETKLDLENRFYSKHRATCGIAQKYETSGPSQWRDPMKPVQILAKLCKDNKLEGPVFMYNRVRIGTKVFNFQSEYEEEGTKLNEEYLALAILHRWHEIPYVGCKLVPEHVETRPLYHPDKPGIEQGKLEMWVDMFPMDMPLPKLPTDISPRKPKR